MLRNARVGEVPRQGALAGMLPARRSLVRRRLGQRDIAPAAALGIASVYIGSDELSSGSALASLA